MYIISIGIQFTVIERRIMICQPTNARIRVLCSLTNIPYVKCYIVPLFDLVHIGSFNGDYGSLQPTMVHLNHMRN